MKTVLNESSLKEILRQEPPFRFKQIIEYYLKNGCVPFSQMTFLSKKLRVQLETCLRDKLFKGTKVISSEQKDTFKAQLTCYDGSRIESVLMKNKKGKWSVCLSTQVGCGMGCDFCMTGSIGYKRNLDLLEILFQYVFWKDFINHNHLSSTISNLVYMGMGEPLMNYETVRESLIYFSKFVSIGPNQMTISTVGLIKPMNRLLDDPKWPKVKIAISIHSFNDQTRKKLVPIHSQSFFKELKQWSRHYHQQYGARTRPLTFEYVMLKGVNDSKDELKAMNSFLKNESNCKVNLIPYNFGDQGPYESSDEQTIERFCRALSKNRITVTVRRSAGTEIKAACGQLAG